MPDSLTTDNPSMRVFDQYESNVRAYCRSFPTVFESARGHLLTDQAGRRYIDFFAGAGALNYGHNPPPMKRALIDYLTRDGITHSLDMATSAKAAFIETFQSVILQPRNMDHKLLFPGPTGTNSVESALKLARKVTGRSGIISFTNAFHGMTLGALAVTGNAFKRGGAGVGLSDGTVMPYDGYFGEDDDTLNWLATMLDDQGSGVDLPAAVIVETIQGEGGLAAARFDWLKNLETLCGDRGMLLIVDDVQAGCGRTGPFFSFEPAGINPDIICLSKSISGYGLPMAVTLVRPEHDVFDPGEHNGTFRGHNPAFITATCALDHWRDGALAGGTHKRAGIIAEALNRMAQSCPELKPEVRGRGLMQGLALDGDGLAEQVSHEAFRRGVILETSGPASEVAKIMPPLTIPLEALSDGLGRVAEAVDTVAMNARSAHARVA